MQFTAKEDARLEILLRRVAKIFVLFHDLLEKVADVRELVVCGVIVAVYLVLHGRLGRRDGNDALNKEEDWTRQWV